MALLLALLAAASGTAAERPAEVASYRMEARLDPTSHQVHGRQTISWRNRSAQPAAELCFHLYLNGFRNTASSWLRHQRGGAVDTLAPDGWGWIELTRLSTAAGDDLLPGLTLASADDGNPDDRSVARVALPAPVPAGGELVLESEFLAQLPRAVARTGHHGDYHLVAQWFPKLGVRQEDGSWSCHPFYRSSEFHADYGSYDVTLEVPRDWVVGATGERVEPPGEGSDGTVRHRFRQPAVHDFAWTAWPGFVERRRTFRHPGLPEVEVTLLLPPDSRWLTERYFAALFGSLRLFGEWYGPYPFSTLTMVDPPWGAGATGGMEYPTFITTGGGVLNPLATQRPEGVTVHEFGHQYFYGLLASDEVTESFLDEGITTYATSRVLRRLYGDPAFAYEVWGVPVVFPTVRREHPIDTSARFFRRPTVDPIARTSWGYLDRTAYGALTYSKMALLMEQAERTLGTAAMERAMRAYAETFRWRQPRATDLVETLSRVGGRDLTPLFAQLLWGSDALDYAVTTAESRRRRAPEGVFGRGGERRTLAAGDGERPPGFASEVVVRRLGGVKLPLTTELVFADGQRLRLDWDGEERWVRYRITGPELLWAEADPDEVQVLDVDRLNNSRRVEADRRASRRWAQRLRFWLQNLLETVAAFA